MLSNLIANATGSMLSQFHVDQTLYVTTCLAAADHPVAVLPHAAEDRDLSMTSDPARRSCPQRRLCMRVRNKHPVAILWRTTMTFNLHCGSTHCRNYIHCGNYIKTIWLQLLQVLPASHLASLGPSRRRWWTFWVESWESLGKTLTGRSCRTHKTVIKSRRSNLQLISFPLYF